VCVCGPGYGVLYVYVYVVPQECWHWQVGAVQSVMCSIIFSLLNHKCALGLMRWSYSSYSFFVYAAVGYLEPLPKGFDKSCSAWNYYQFGYPCFYALSEIH